MFCLWDPLHIRYSDDGFGNLIKLTFQQQLMVYNHCFPAYEDEL